MVVGSKRRGDSRRRVGIRSRTTATRLLHDPLVRLLSSSDDVPPGFRLPLDLVSPSMDSSLPISVRVLPLRPAASLLRLGDGGQLGGSGLERGGGEGSTVSVRSFAQTNARRASDVDAIYACTNATDARGLSITLWGKERKG